MWAFIPVFASLALQAGAYDYLSPSFSIPLSIRSKLPAAVNTSAGITSIALSSDRQSYYAVIQAGDIYFRVALDTGSSDLWIVSSGCSSHNCKNIPTYPLTYESSTFVPINGNSTGFNIGYADTTSQCLFISKRSAEAHFPISVASGFVAQESIQLANLTVQNQTFGGSSVPLAFYR